MPDPKYKPADLLGWLQMFQSCRTTAWLSVPDEIYSVLRSRKLLDAEHDITPLARRVLAKAA